jgi:hypothetical protein
MGKLNFDLEGNELPRAEGSRYLGGMTRPLTKEIRLDPKPAKIFEQPAEPPAKSKVEELRETVADIPAKRGKGRPKTGQVKPWVSLGMTKSTYYVKKSKGEV